MSATLDKIIEEVKHLPPDELQQLRTTVDSLLSRRDEAAAEDEFERELIAEGVLSDRADLGSQPSTPAPSRPFKPVPITGKLVSEIVIEERR
jgi:hypothetical protein